MSCKEVVTFWLDMAAPISLPSRIFVAAVPQKGRMPVKIRLHQVARVVRLLRERETLLVDSPRGREVPHPVREAARGR